ncbi:DUF2971 domain-containing protein [Shewanella sp. SR43-4]|uniref:DUF2971 domain-containing protein n=1 Tax=Shewanella sp. SR43-4 TaxID=2760942 RepID=UPI0015FE69D7|nr:DUF2971 domain-containing protein [Shewanella sp. SR43-4]MBB1319172.1 DUF2971 domain-containing protein [Shewanella sp. SR43-4]
MTSFFKYCPIHSHESLDKEYSLINLFSNQATFSRRENFNDLFDSKVLIKLPTRDRVRRTYQKLSGESKRTFKQLYMGADAKANFDLLVGKIEGVLDSYLFYCVTDNPINNLMWSHYANSHNGFCIEWETDSMTLDKVIYQHQLPTLDLLELLESTIGLRTQEEIISQPWAALKVKLMEWEYEQEYRINLSHKAQSLVVKDLGKFALVKFQPEWIKSIIFGYRMPVETRDYLRSKMLEGTTFQEVVISPDNSGLQLKRLA